MARFAGSVDTTSGHSPVGSTYVSFLHPENNTTNTKVMIVNSFVGFIFFF